MIAREIFHLVGLVIICGISISHASEVSEDVDVRALRAFETFMEVCVLGKSGKEGRINALDSHPDLERMPVPSQSVAGEAGRMIWLLRPSTFYILEANSKCMAIIDDNDIKNRIGKFVETATIGKRDEDVSAARFEKQTLPDNVVSNFQERNVAIETYLLRKDDSDYGVLLGIEKSIVESTSTDPLRIWARYLVFDK